MVLLRPLLMFALLLLPALGQEPRKDPFLAPEDEIRAMIPRNFAVMQVSVQLDWVRLPHLSANQLIRQHLKHTADGPALYKAVLELVAQKKAERLDITTVMVRGGQKSGNESVVEHPYPTEFDPAQIIEDIPLSGDLAKDPVIPASPSSFSTRNTGRTCEMEATVGEDRTTIDLNLAPEWIEHLADIPWSTGPSETKQPVFGTNKLTAQLLMKNGEWQMAGLFTPPHEAPEGKLYGSVDVLPAERVLLFARASLEAEPKLDPDAERFSARQVTVLAEWIEVDTTIMADLLTKHPAFANTDAIRDALDPMLLDGRASLLESAALQIRGGQRSKIESITEYPYPTENDPPAGDLAKMAGVPNPLETAPKTPRILPASPAAYATKELGTSLEVEATVGEDGFTLDLNLAPQLTFNLGTVSYGQGPSEAKQPKFQTMKCSSQLIAFAGSTSMITSYDAPLRGGEQKLPAVQKRKVILFVRAIL